MWPAIAPTSGPTAPAMEIATLELPLAEPLARELVVVHGGVFTVLDAASAEIRSCEIASL